jgi:gluconate 2-dehydrogenase gamma chain
MTMNRRNMLQLLASAPAAAGLAWTDAEAKQAFHDAQLARSAAQATAAAYKPKFFTPHEWDTVRVLVDIIIPKDERSGSATDAGVPEFMDFIVMDQPLRQTAMRGGLAWIDRECQSRFDKTFLDCDAAQRTALLDDIAWPQRPSTSSGRSLAELSHGVEFFSSFRDLTANGFWTSRMGLQDLQYIGNTYVPEWVGCPDECLQHLNVSYPAPPPPPKPTRGRTRKPRGE